MKRSLLNLVLATIVLSGLGWLGYRAEAQPRVEPKQSSGVRKFMRKKLAITQDILEGLATEDFNLIGSAAKQLKSMSEHADFMVSKEAMYRQHAEDFERIAGKLEKAAGELKLEGSALQYVNLTMNCIECHKYVRDVLVAGKAVPADAELLAGLATLK